VSSYHRIFGPVTITLAVAVLAAALGAEAVPVSLADTSRFHGEYADDELGDAIAGGADVNGDGYDDLLLCAMGNTEGGGTWAGQAYLFLGSSGGWGSVVNASSADASFIGDPSEALCVDVAVANDVNGDGYDELLMSADTGPNGDGSGKVYLVLGGSGGWAMDQPIAGSDASYLGEATWDNAGTSLAGVGDVDGDGFGDLLIGAPSALGDIGAAYLIHGATAGWALDQELTDADVVFGGENVDDEAGWSLDGAGDVDGDGIDDMVISAMYWGINQGKVYLVLGVPGGWGASVPLASADATFLGTATGDAAGRSLAGAGDVDGDGYDDILVSAYNDPGGDTGIVYLIHGQPGGWALDVPLASAGGSIVGDMADDWLGYALDGVGDVNGDGLADILMTAPYSDEFAEGAGTSYVFLGRAGGFGALTPASDANAWYLGHSYNDWMGRQGARAGDVNGDGFDDLLVGCNQDDGYARNAGIVVLVPGYAEEDQDGDGWTSWSGDCDDSDPAMNLDDVDGDGTTTCAGDCDDFDPLMNALDLDGDGYSNCDGDCDDADLHVSPGAPELCNGQDDDCDGGVESYELDGDGDGYMECEECDDADATVHPGASETCGDGIDTDCAGDLDETEVDDDGDGYAECQGDCDDLDGTIHPGAPEVCNDGVDDDCDESTDETEDLDGDGYGPCDASEPDCDDTRADIHPGAEEVCNGIDDDCDGEADVVDLDGDGYGGCESDCDDGDADIHPGATETPYDGIDQDCSGADLDDVDGDGFAGGEGGEDCDDQDPLVHPDATDIPYDGLDQDCADGDLQDVDGDGYVLGLDCLDTDASVHPDAVEICDDELDNDCDQRVDLVDPDCAGDGEEPDGCACRHETPQQPRWSVIGLALGVLLASRRRGPR